METAMILLLCTLAAVTAQMSPYQMWGMGGSMSGGMMNGIANPIMGNGWRPHMYPMMGGSPMWRSHSIIRMAPGSNGIQARDGATGNPLAPIATLAQGFLTNMPKVPGSEEILSHMTLVNQNIKPYVDSIADFLYHPTGQHAAPAAASAPAAEPAKARQAIMTPVIVTGVPSAVPATVMTAPVTNMRSASGIVDDCGPQDTHRWNRDMTEWVY